MNFDRLATLTRALVHRATASDFQRERASDEERTLLAAAAQPITDSLAQDYVAWRRAVLWVASALLLAGLVFALVDHKSAAEQVVAATPGAEEMNLAEHRQAVARIEEGFGKGNLEILDGLQYFLLFVKISVAALTLGAAMRWLRVGASRSWTRWAWLMSLVVPLLVSAWPWSYSLDFSHLERGGMLGAGGGQMIKQQVSVAIAAVLVLTVAPKLIALFPGIMRSALTLKTLLPQATAPGWLTVIFAPFLAGFLLLVLSLLSQVQGSWLLIAGVGLLIVGPCLYVRRAKDLVRPHTEEGVRTVVGGIRHQALLCNLGGFGLLAFYLFGLDSLPWSTVVHLLLDAGGGVLLTMVAISDITIALLAFGHQQGAEFHASDLRVAYEQRLHALATAGLTDVDQALGMQDIERVRSIGKGAG